VPSSMELTKLNQSFEKSSEVALLQWALENFSPDIALASSFGAEDVVLIDILVKLDPKIRVFTLDTGRLNEETYEVMEKVRQKYTIGIDIYFPDKEAVQKLEKEKGLYSFRQSVDNRKECCGIRKVEPLKRALKGLKAWITGLRKGQAMTRSEIAKIEIEDASTGLLKINPLVDWSEQDIWNYIKKNSVPYNRLHDQGYPSIGCSPCTRAVKEGEDIRAGRWWWESPEHKECGIHLPLNRVNRAK